MKDKINKIRPEILKVYGYLHKNPEVSWKEVGTTKYIKSLLDKLNCRVQTFEDSTGLIGEIGKGKPVIGIRADMDALWQEVDGQFCANHSCGHDAHMAIVIGVIYLLKYEKTLSKGTVRFIFQPAEEKGLGALHLLEKNVMDDIDYLYGVHLRPHDELDNRTAAPAIIHGATYFINGQISGEDCHGARPHLGTNAIQVGASFIHMLNGIHLNPMIPYSIKMTSFHAGGESVNIIPGTAKFSLDLRAQTNESIEELMFNVEEIVKSLENRYQVKIDLEKGTFIAAAKVSKEAQKIMEKAITNVLGKHKLMAPIITSGGDDFHFYTLNREKIKATMLGLGCDLKPGLHHPHMSFKEEIIPVGIEILAKAVLLTLERT